MPPEPDLCLLAAQQAPDVLVMADPDEKSDVQGDRGEVARSNEPAGDGRYPNGGEGSQLHRG